MAETFRAMCGSVFQDSEDEWGYLFQVKGAPNLYELNSEYDVVIEEVSDGEGQTFEGNVEGQTTEAQPAQEEVT